MYYNFYLKQAKLNGIDEEIDMNGGNSKFLRCTDFEKLTENLKTLKTSVSSEMLFNLFLPEFKMETPFHFILLKEKFCLFNNLVDQITECHFNDFFEYDNHFYVEKIKSMFIFILENVNAYYPGAVELFYCTLSYDDSDENDELTNNVEKIQKWLKRIRNYLFEDKKFSEHSAFIVKRN